ncbi:Cyclic pyranopterin monophosphate synthase 1 [Kordia antarctica]|uniref:S-adenosylmethionine-dependent nucleotide dehydratase n=1 Tax=Kordia antarctica TaxID=1218801 RepID=A0A7L4ZQB6_9FLAO|nr:viperin family antiviral radical SAM protein [Kordia antarctica]QHI38933.1 Cyclic pyranopterin monophosphate synthase 1 [Kordia antarctica]
MNTEIKQLKRKNRIGSTEKESRMAIPSVNFHLWQPCNMRCKFCFATFLDVKQTILPKGHLPEAEAVEVVKSLANYGFKKITFVGGEPLLCKWLPKLIRTAKELGLNTTVVTNGSKLTDEFLQQNKPYLDWIALSIDSLNKETNIKTGRTERKIPLTEAFYKDRINAIKAHGYKLKINTVVNAHNYKELMVDFIKEANPKRWKIFQVLPITGQNDGKIEDLKITTAQYESFLQRHEELAVCVPESNDAIKGSYVMVDPAGRFFDNAEGTHNYSKPILEAGVFEAIKAVNYDIVKFIDRKGFYNW